jgi:hypothetical protein
MQKCKYKELKKPNWTGSSLIEKKQKQKVHEGYWNDWGTNHLFKRTWATRVWIARVRIKYTNDKLLLFIFFFYLQLLFMFVEEKWKLPRGRELPC